MTASALAALLALCAAPAAAGSRADWRVVGFSGDGRYLAYEEWADLDPVDGYWARVTVVDGAADRRARAPFSAEHPGTDVSSDTTRAEALGRAASTLAALKVVRGDEGSPLPLVFADGDRNRAEFTRDGAAYGLTLRQTDAPMEGCLRHGRATAAFALVLRGPRGARTLHDDGGRVPASRGRKGCVDGYRLEAARAKGRYLYVFVEVSGPGSFEGTDETFIPVAAEF